MDPHLLPDREEVRVDEIVKMTCDACCNDLEEAFFSSFLLHHLLSVHRPLSFHTYATIATRYFIREVYIVAPINRNTTDIASFKIRQPQISTISHLTYMQHFDHYLSSWEYWFVYPCRNQSGYSFLLQFWFDIFLLRLWQNNAGAGAGNNDLLCSSLSR